MNALFHPIAGALGLHHRVMKEKVARLRVSRFPSDDQRVGGVHRSLQASHPLRTRMLGGVGGVPGNGHRYPIFASPRA